MIPRPRSPRNAPHAALTFAQCCAFQEIRVARFWVASILQRICGQRGGSILSPGQGWHRRANAQKSYKSPPNGQPIPPRAHRVGAQSCGAVWAFINFPRSCIDLSGFRPFFHGCAFWLAALACGGLTSARAVFQIARDDFVHSAEHFGPRRRRR